MVSNDTVTAYQNEEGPKWDMDRAILAHERECNEGQAPDNVGIRRRPKLLSGSFEVFCSSPYPSPGVQGPRSSQNLGIWAK